MSAETIPAETISAETIVMYWRPGCGFCAALERQLVGAQLTFDKRNIWDSADDAAYVRSVADGNEIVPTVVVNGTAMVNPSLADIQTAMVPG